MLPLALLLVPVEPIVPGTPLSSESQWAAVLASPKVMVPGGGPSGTGVVVAVKDGFAYLLTSAHVATFDGIELQFTSRAAYPKPAWFAKEPEVLKRWPDPDLALIRFRVPPDRAVSVVPLAGPGERTKVFPVPGWAVGVGRDQAATVEVDQVMARRYIRRPGKAGAFFWETDRPPVPGRSGGPLLDGRGRVVGICTATQDGRGYYTHLDEILAALKRDGFGWLVAAKP